MALRRISLLLALCASTALGHDMVQQGQAGPYQSAVYINPHARTAGFVEAAARFDPASPTRVAFAVTKIDEPPADFTEATPEGELFRVSLPIPADAHWRLHVRAEGPLGEGTFSVPVSAAAPLADLVVWGAQLLRAAVWMFLSAVLFLVARRTRGSLRRFAPLSAVVGLPLLFVGWGEGLTASVLYHPAVYQRIYRPVNLDAAVEDGRLRITLTDTGWTKFRRLDDLIPDHGHLMHLYVLRLPELERVYHLHPQMTAAGVFEKTLPDMPAGRYFLVADIVHDNGLWEAPQGELNLTADVAGSPFEGDDSGGAGHPISAPRWEAEAFEFDDGSRLVWRRPSEALTVNVPTLLAFQFEDADGAIRPDAELYMGMLGHAAIVRHDRQVFTHVHPTGSIPMASLEAFDRAKDSDMAHHMHHGESPQQFPAEVIFPHAFAEPGPYRLIIQMKIGGRVRTSFFDATVD